MELNHAYYASPSMAPLLTLFTPLHLGHEASVELDLQRLEIGLATGQRLADGERHLEPGET
jgi:hypothetical protein